MKNLLQISNKRDFLVRSNCWLIARSIKKPQEMKWNMTMLRQLPDERINVNKGNPSLKDDNVTHLCVLQILSFNRLTLFRAVFFDDQPLNNCPSGSVNNKIVRISTETIQSNHNHCPYKQNKNVQLHLIKLLHNLYYRINIFITKLFTEKVTNSGGKNEAGIIKWKNIYNIGQRWRHRKKKKNIKNIRQNDKLWESKKMK